MAVQDPPSSSTIPLHSSSHRLPTVSASQALDSLRSQGRRTLSTGLKQVDVLLSGNRHSHQDAGIERGSVLEVWGPPGSGKTTLAMRMAANVLRAGSRVVWVDTAGGIVADRLKSIVSKQDRLQTDEEPLRNLHHYYTPSLAHLLATILHPPSHLLSANAGLLVIDGLHTLMDVAYPRFSSSNTAGRGDTAKWAAARRYSVLGSLASALKKLAALHDMVCIVTTGCATRPRHGTGAGSVLVPGVSGMEWDSGVSSRVVLFRDLEVNSSRHHRSEDATGRHSARYVGVQKVCGKLVVEEEGDVGHVVPFMFDESGIVDMGTSTSAPGDSSPSLPQPLPRPMSSPIKVTARKRKAEEVADSEEEEISSEYGWLDDDVIAAEGLIDEGVLVELPDAAADGDANDADDPGNTGDATTVARSTAPRLLSDLQ